MRIAIVHNIGGGGAKRLLHEMTRRLSERAGHRLDLFVPASAREEYLPLAPYCENVRTYGKRPAPDPGGHGGNARQMVRRVLGAAAHDVIRDVVWVRRREGEVAALSALYAQMARDINAGGYDVAYVDQCHTMLVPDVVRHLRMPVVFYCHDTLRRAYEWSLDTPPDYDAVTETLLRRKRLGQVMTPVLLRFREREERRYVENLRRVQAVLTNSWYSREGILRTTGVDARVCPPGVNADFFTPDASVPKENMVLSVGALVPHKRHEFVLDAVAALPAANRPRLEVIGYETYFGEPGLGPFARMLQDRARGAGVELTIRKDITDETLRDAYRRARVFAFAPYLEPFGIVPLEAAACGTPTVGVSEAGIRETARHEETGLLTGLDVREFARALRCLLCNDEMARRLGAEARRRAVAQWTWDRSADILEETLRRVVREREAT